MRSEKFEGSHETTLKITGCVAIGIIAILVENNGLAADATYGIALSFLAVLFFYVNDFLTYTIIEDEELKNRFGVGYSYNLPFKKVVRINRGAVFKIRKWGSRLEIWYLDEAGKEAVRTIQESAYSAETIKKLVARLKELNPNIKLDPQYQDLIDGKIDPKKFKKIDPTVHS